MSTQITIEGIEQPREGAKMGSVKAGGRYYKVWPDKLDGFAVGATYEVETESGEFKGKPWTKIKTSKLVGGNGNGSPTADRGGMREGDRNGFIPLAPGEDRSSRIERQHSQHMALRYFHIKGGLPDTTDKLRAMIDWFQRDVGHAPTAPAPREPVAANGDNEGDFQL